MPPGVSAIEYHERTKHTPRSVRGASLDFDNKPRPDTHYTGLPVVATSGDRPVPSMPALDAIASDGWPGAGELGLDTLLALCYASAGITKTIRRQGHEHEFRAAACTGALYHVDLYPVCGPLPGLEAGVYHYDPREDVLERLRDGDYRRVVAAASRTPSVASAPVTVVATSTWWRNAWKYGARTYRHAFWDSGTIIANLLAAARSFEVPAEIVTGFADGIVAELLGVDPEWRAPLALAPLGEETPVEPAELTIEPIEPATEPLGSDPQVSPLIHDAWQASTLPDGETASAWRTRGDRPVDGRGPGDGNSVSLDDGAAETEVDRPLHATIRRRGSCRDYAHDPVSYGEVSTVLDRAVRELPLDVCSPRAGPLQFVDCYCIANGIDGLENGVYQYNPDTGQLERLRSGTFREEAGRLALGQRLGADAAACVYFMADLPAITAALGDRGYRVAQFEAAITAGRLYIATYAHDDLGGTGLTFFDDMVTAFLEPRAEGQTPMFLYTIGRPA